MNLIRELVVLCNERGCIDMCVLVYLTAFCFFLTLYSLFKKFPPKYKKAGNLEPVLNDFVGNRKIIHGDPESR